MIPIQEVAGGGQSGDPFEVFDHDLLGPGGQPSALSVVEPGLFAPFSARPCQFAVPFQTGGFDIRSRRGPHLAQNSPHLNAALCFMPVQGARI